jgi:tetratricopeptide (TPR) repeat protein
MALNCLATRRGGDWSNKRISLATLLFVAGIFGTAACNRSSNESNSAPTDFRRSVELRSRELARGESLVVSGIRKYRNGDFDAAGKDLAEAVVLAPQSAQGWMALGMTEFGRDKYFEAAQAFHKASVLVPDRFEPHYNLAQVLEAAGLAKAAIQEYDRALELAPDDLDTMECLVRCLIVHDIQLDRARTLIDRILTSEIRPQWRQWLARQAHILDERGNTTRPAANTASKP